MGFIGFILIGIGSLMMIIFGIILLIKAFKKSIGWGIGSFLLLPVFIVFLVQNWSEVKSTAIKWVIGFVLTVFGFSLGAPKLAELMESNTTTTIEQIELK